MNVHLPTNNLILVLPYQPERWHCSLVGMEGPKASSDDWAVTSRTTVDNVDPSHIQGEDTCGILDGSFLELLGAASKLRGDSQSPRLSSAVSEAKHLRASPLYTCMLQRWTPHVSINTFGLPSYHHLNCKYEAYFYCRYEVLRTSGHLKGVCFCVFFIIWSGCLLYTLLLKLHPLSSSFQSTFFVFELQTLVAENLFGKVLTFSAEDLSPVILVAKKLQKTRALAVSVYPGVHQTATEKTICRCSSSIRWI